MRNANTSNLAVFLMSKRFSTLLFFLLVLLGTGAYVLLTRDYSNYTMPKVELDASLLSGKPVLNLSDARITQLIVRPAAEPEIRVTLDPRAGWRVVAPFTDLADPEQVRRFIDTFRGIRAHDVIEKPGNLAEYGLQRPRLVVRLIEASGRATEIRVGARRAGSYFVQTSLGPSVFLVGNLPAEVLDIKPFKLVAHNLLQFPLDDVVRVVVNKAPAEPGGQAEKIVIQRKGLAWVSTVGGQERIVFNVDAFLRGLQSLPASGIAGRVDARALGFFPAPGSFQVELTLKNNKVHRLDLGKATPDGRHFYVRVPDRPQLYTLVEFVANNLKSRLDLIDTSVLGIKPGNLSEIKVVLPKAAGQAQAPQPITLFREEDTWKTSDGKIAFGVAGLLESLDNIEAFSAAPKADPATYGFTPEAGGIEVTFTLNDKSTITLNVGKKTPDGKFAYVQTSHREGVYLASAETANRIARSVSQIRSTLLVFNPAEITQIKVTQVDDNGSQRVSLFTKRGNDWYYNGVKKDPKPYQEFLTALAQMGISSFAPKQPEEQYGFFPKPGSLRLELTGAGGRTMTLDIGGSVQIGTGWFATVNYYVRAGDLPDVGFLGEADALTLTDGLAAMKG